MKKVDTYHVGQYLFRDVANLIDETRKTVAYTVNSALTYMYWKIGKRIKLERWSVRTLRQKIEDMLYERTAISRRQNVPQGQYFINRRFQPTEGTVYTRKVPQGRHFTFKISSLRDFGGRWCCLLRRLKPTVNNMSSLRDFSTEKQVQQFAFDIKTDINFCPIVASVMQQSKIINHQSKIKNVNGNQISI